jgi:hypothetical protein
MGDLNKELIEGLNSLREFADLLEYMSNSNKIHNYSHSTLKFASDKCDTIISMILNAYEEKEEK